MYSEFWNDSLSGFLLIFLSIHKILVFWRENALSQDGNRDMGKFLSF